MRSQSLNAVNIRLPLVGCRIRFPERSQSVTVFRDLLQGGPYIITREIDVFPAEWGQVGEELVGDVLDLAQSGNGALKVSGIPEDNRGDEEVEA